MKMKASVFRILLLMAVCWWFQSCIHEYPSITPSGVGEDPTKINGFIELSYDLSWDHLFHSIDFQTKAARGDNSHRFVVEVSKDGKSLLHDVEYIDDEEFSNGRFRRKLSIPLAAEEYEIAAWYDRVDDNGNTFFDASNLENINILNRSTTDTLAFHCAFSHAKLDLRKYSGQSKTVNAVQEMEMMIPGARFQVVATDVQKFITLQKEALNQGDKFSILADFSRGGYDVFNAYTGNSYHSGNTYSLSGAIRLPFAEYDEITIGQGFMFCQADGEIGMRLTVMNSALASVSQTGLFSFPVKPGFITVVKGDFLTNPLDGVFTVDNIWSGEILFNY